VVDAGHMAVESHLVDKEAIRTIQSKRNQQYNEDDYRQLEALMYDKMSLRLEDAQVFEDFRPYKYSHSHIYFQSSS
jgi:vacuolar protein sorting-associated protein 13A/C